MSVALVNGRVLRDDTLVEGQCVLLEGARIAAIVDADDPRGRAAQRYDLGGGLLLPGFIDSQVNGGGGVLFNDSPSVEAIRTIGAAHRRFGTTGFLPTLISADLDVVARAIAAVRSAIQAGVPGVLGLHIEGPYLNAARKGVHDPAKLRELDASAVGLLTSLREGRTLVTLAPEMTTPDIIEKLVAAGVVVSAGHTNATYAEIEPALRHGLTGFTHLFNAMSQLTGREPGAVGAALSDQASWCGIIVDGVHTDPVVLRIALKCKPHERFMLVTDAMPSVGTTNGSFDLQGRRITVRGYICVDEDGTLAGSNIDMASSVRNAMSLLGLPLPAAVRMAS
ncbi:MAG: N-acetylglucosamine-6-phosphate deacetylase, partial [Steroidobacterales bacterium]